MLRQVFRRNYVIHIVNRTAVRSAISQKQTILDVREPAEFKIGAIPTANLIPLSEITAAFKMETKQFKIKYGMEIPDKNEPVYVYCRSGKRSTDAAELLSKLGYVDIKNYTGSFLDWTAE
jgi:rhodanese-related sulfurtransferase